MTFTNLFGRGASASDPGAERQAGAIPFTLVEDRVVFLLITTRRTGRWSFPKGALVEGLPDRELAAKEAWEEAGVTGRVAQDAIGTYLSWKTRGLRRSRIEIAMYPLLVERQDDDWAEKGQRHRHWATLKEARRLLSDAQLVAMVEKVAREASDAVPVAS